MTKTGTGYPETAAISGTGSVNGTSGYGFTVTGIDSAGTANDGDQLGVSITGLTSGSLTPQTLLTSGGGQIGDIYVK